MKTLALLFAILVAAVAAPAAPHTIRFDGNNEPNQYLEYFVAMKQADGSFREVTGATVQSTASDPAAPYVTRINVDLPENAVVRIVPRRKLTGELFTPSPLLTIQSPVNTPGNLVLEK